jgi:hypothetical protein
MIYHRVKAKQPMSAADANDVIELKKTLEQVFVRLYELEKAVAELTQYLPAIQKSFSGTIAPQGSVETVLNMTEEERLAAMHETSPPLQPLDEMQSAHGEDGDKPEDKPNG